MRILILSLLVFALSTGDALAYVGPGLGLGVLGAVFSTILAVLLAIVGVVWYPLKRILAKLRTRSGGPNSVPPADKKDEDAPR